MHTVILMSFNPPSLVNEDQSFSFPSGVCLKAWMVCIFPFFLFKEELGSPPSPSISPVIATLKWVWIKHREQQHSMSTWHEDQHISHQGTTGVFWCVVTNSQPGTLSFFSSRWRNVHTRRTRSLELSRGEKRCQRQDNKEGEFYFSAC